MDVFEKQGIKMPLPLTLPAQFQWLFSKGTKESIGVQCRCFVILLLTFTLHFYAVFGGELGNFSHSVDWIVDGRVFVYIRSFVYLNNLPNIGDS